MRYLTIIYCLSLISSFAQPVNDQCASATLLCAGQASAGTTLDATLNNCGNCSDSYVSCYTPNATVWYSFTTTAAGNVQIDLSNVLFDTDPNRGQTLSAMLLDFANAPCDGSVAMEVGNCLTAQGGPFQLTNTAALVANTTYYIQINADMGATMPASATFDIQISGTAVSSNYPPFTMQSSNNGFCSSDSTTLSIDLNTCPSPGTVYWYDTTGREIAQTTSGSLVYQGSGDVSIYAYTQCGGCSDTVFSDTIDLTISDLVVDAGPDFSIEQGESVTFQSSTNADSYSWTPSSSLNSGSLVSPTATPTSTTTYYFTGVRGTCSLIDEVTVTVSPQLNIPEAFTPNGDGVNEVFEIEYISRYPNANVKIYDRWGQKIFEVSNYGAGKEWDGTFGGSRVNPGVYYYVIDLKDDSFPDPLAGYVSVVY